MPPHCRVVRCASRPRRDHRDPAPRLRRSISGEAVPHRKLTDPRGYAAVLITIHCRSISLVGGLKCVYNVSLRTRNRSLRTRTVPLRTRNVSLRTRSGTLLSRPGRGRTSSGPFIGPLRGPKNVGDLSRCSGDPPPRALISVAYSDRALLYKDEAIKPVSGSFGFEYDGSAVDAGGGKAEGLLHELDRLFAVKEYVRGIVLVIPFREFYVRGQQIGHAYQLAVGL